MKRILRSIAFAQFYLTFVVGSIDGEVFWVSQAGASGPGSLAEALALAYAHPGEDTIVFTNLAGATVVASNVPPLLDVTLVGISEELGDAPSDVPTLRIDDQPLFVPPGSSVQLTRLRLRGGAPSFYGGMISNAGTLRIVQCELNRTRNNDIAGDTRFGGAIFSTGRLSIVASSLYSNSVYYCNLLSASSTQEVSGGAVCIGGGSLAMTNCTLSYNKANACNGQGSAGAVRVLKGDAVLAHCTFTENQADRDLAMAGPATLLNCIIVNEGMLPRGISNRVVGAQLLAADLAAAGLGALSKNGNWMLTHALHVDSLALEAGVDISGSDQLGQARPYGPRPDLGALELVWPPGWSALITSIEGDGVVERDPRRVLFPTGSSVTLQAIANEDNAFATWSGDKNSSSAVIRDLVITNNRLLTAHFVEAPATEVLSPGLNHYVTNTDQWNKGSFRQAIRNVNASGGGTIGQ